MCLLCDYVKTCDEDHRFGSFVLIDKCKTCGVPILVLQFHNPCLDREEKQEFLSLMKNQFDTYKPRNIGMRSIPDHWHEHLIKK